MLIQDECVIVRCLTLHQFLLLSTNMKESVLHIHWMGRCMCSTKGASTLKVHKHEAEDIIEQMVMNTEGLMDGLLSEYKSIISRHDGDIGTH